MILSTAEKLRRWKVWYLTVTTVQRIDIETEITQVTEIRRSGRRAVYPRSSLITIQR